MPTVEANRQHWDADYDWTAGGDEWSAPWGCAEMQWYVSILPRLHPFVPAETILEIAPGFGRWTAYLRQLCRRMVVVDLSARCIEACKARFADSAHIEYHVNDGTSLAMVRDESVDLAFSFDSLVH